MRTRFAIGRQKMETVNNESKWLAGFSYLFWPLSLAIVATRLKKERFLRFHGYQALFLGICGSVVYLVAGPVIRLIPVFGGAIMRTAVIFWLLLIIYLAYRCTLGEYFKVPLIYDLAQGNME